MKTLYIFHSSGLIYSKGGEVLVSVNYAFITIDYLTSSSCNPACSSSSSSIVKSWSIAVYENLTEHRKEMKKMIFVTPTPSLNME